MSKIGYIFVLVVLLVNCNKEREIGPQCVECPNDSLNLNVETKLFLVNEGNFGWGNASLSLYDIESSTVQNQIYQTANDENLVGDVAMSLETINGKGYLTVNNSDKVVIIDLTTFEKIGEITSVNSPRFIKQVSASKAYLTSLYGNKIYVIDLELDSVVSTIQTGGWNEDLVLYNERIFTVNRDLDVLQIVDINTDVIIETINTGKSPNSILLDMNNQLWVLCDGGFEEEKAELISISTSDFSILTIFQFEDIQDSPRNLEINGDSSILYFINQGIAAMSILDNVLSASVIVDQGNRTFYGLGIDPKTGDIYISDARDYAQEGQIYRYAFDGLEIDNFKVGIIPGTFTFYSE